MEKAEVTKFKQLIKTATGKSVASDEGEAAFVESFAMFFEVLVDIRDLLTKEEPLRHLK